MSHRTNSSSGVPPRAQTRVTLDIEFQTDSKTPLERQDHYQTVSAVNRNCVESLDGSGKVDFNFECTIPGGDPSWPLAVQWFPGQLPPIVRLATI